METNLLSISKIFTERIFRIPDYQRGYAWTSKQIKDFYNDLIQLDEDKNHYTGVLTLEDVPPERLSEWHDDHWIIKHKSYHPYYIVDGQQRLTTAIILINSILEAAVDFESINYTLISDIKKKFIFDSKDKGISRSYIFGYEKDNPSYEFLKMEIFREESETSNQKQETIYTNNLENAKKYFTERLKELDKEGIEILYRKLTQNFLFNIYIITSDIDVFVAFETMNNRGKPLSHLELLKNRLIFLSTKLTEDQFEKQRLRKRINECWKSIYHNLGRNKENPLDDDSFLVNHFMIYFGSELWTEMEFEERNIRLPHYYRFQRDDYANYLLEKKFTISNINQNNISLSDIDKYVRSLQSSVETWYNIFNPKKSNYDKDIQNWLDKLNRLGVPKIAPLIMTFFQFESNSLKRLEFLQDTEKLIFSTLLHRVRYGFLEREEVEFLRTAIEINNGQISTSDALKKIKGASSKMLQVKEFKEHLISSFNDSGFYNWIGIKYFLFEYDLYLAENSKTDRKKIIWNEFMTRDYETTEHIYPQRAKSKCWTNIFNKFTTKQRKQLRNSLGNLLPLSRRKNSSFQNKCFLDKVSSDDSTVGFRYGCYAENEITKYNQWTETEILERGLKLLDFMETRWDIKIGSENERLRFLGLEFLKKKQNKSKAEI